MATGTIKHICSKCYGLDKNGHCMPHKGERRENIDLPVECDDYHPATMMLWYLMACSMNPHFKKKELAMLVILGTLLFFVIITFMMIFGMIPFFKVIFG